MYINEASCISVSPNKNKTYQTDWKFLGERYPQKSIFSRRQPGWALGWHWGQTASLNRSRLPSPKETLRVSKRQARDRVGFVTATGLPRRRNKMVRWCREENTQLHSHWWCDLMQDTELLSLLPAWTREVTICPACWLGLVGKDPMVCVEAPVKGEEFYSYERQLLVTVR